MFIAYTKTERGSGTTKNIVEVSRDQVKTRIVWSEFILYNEQSVTVVFLENRLCRVDYELWSGIVEPRDCWSKEGRLEFRVTIGMSAIITSKDGELQATIRLFDTFEKAVQSLS